MIRMVANLKLGFCLGAMTTLLLGCSNVVKMSGAQEVKNFTFKSFQDAAAAGTFTQNPALTESIQDELKEPLKLVSHLDKNRIVFASQSGKSIIFDTVEASSKVVSASLPVTSKEGWTIAIGENEFWGMAGGRLFYKGSSSSDSATIDDSIESILDRADAPLKPISVSTTDFIGLSGNRLVWLTTVPQLRRELSLQLDSSSLANYSPENVSGAGVIQGRGVWLQVADYLIYILKDSSGRYYPEKSRLPEFKSGSGKISVSRMSGTLSSDEKAVISPQGGLALMSGNSVFMSGSSASKPVSEKESDKNSQTNNPGPVVSPPKDPVVVVSLEELRKQYNDKYKAIFDASCVSCHSPRASKLNTFESVKLYADDASGRVKSGSMPRGGSLGANKNDVALFLENLAKLP